VKKVREEDLLRRIEKIEPKSDSGRSDEAYTVWLCSQMTEEEQLELCRIIKKLEDPDTNPLEREALLDRSCEIQKKAESRKAPTPRTMTFKGVPIRHSETFDAIVAEGGREYAKRKEKEPKEE
jgi:hypothetical protein